MEECRRGGVWLWWSVVVVECGCGGVCMLRFFLLRNSSLPSLSCASRSSELSARVPASTAVVATVVCVVSSCNSLIPSQLAVGRCSGQRAAESHVGVRFSLPRACVNSELFVLL